MNKQSSYLFLGYTTVYHVTLHLIQFVRLSHLHSTHHPNLVTTLTAMEQTTCGNCSVTFADASEKVCICTTCLTRLKTLIKQCEEEEKSFKPESKMVLFLEMPHINKKRRFLYQPKSLHKNILFEDLCSKLIHRFSSKEIRLPSYSHSQENGDISMEINDNTHKTQFITFETLDDLFDGCKILIKLSKQCMSPFYLFVFVLFLFCFCIFISLCLSVCLFGKCLLLLLLLLFFNCFVFVCYL